MQRIGVKFCGNCQPRRDMVELYKRLKAETPDLTFVSWSEPEYAALLVLQACDAACAAMPPFTGPTVEVIVSTLDFVEYEDDEAWLNAVRTALYRAAG